MRGQHKTHTHQFLGRDGCSQLCVSSACVSASKLFPSSNLFFLQSYGILSLEGASLVIRALLNHLGVVVLARRRRKKVVTVNGGVQCVISVHWQLPQLLTTLCHACQTLTFTHSHTLAQETGAHLSKLHALVYIL